MPTVAQYFNLKKRQAQLDFVDVSLEGDIPLFLDPFALSQRQDEWSRECHHTIMVYFQQLVELIRRGEEGGAIELLSYLREPNETRLGFSKNRPKGAGIGSRQAHDLYSTLSQSSAVQTGVLSSLQDCELWVDGIGRDKISDLTTNVIRKHLVSYTHDQAALHGLPLEEAPLPAQFDRGTMTWRTAYANIPTFERAPILLVPKAIVRYDPAYNSNTYYNHFVLEYLQVEAMTADQSLVRTLKSGERRVPSKKDLQQKYPKSKEFLFQFSRAHPDVLERYRAALTRKESERQNDGGSDNADDILAAVRVEGALRAVPPGHTNACTFYSVILGALELLFHPQLLYPVKEREQRGPSARAEFVFQNGSHGGVFRSLQLVHSLPCPNVHFDCRNQDVDLRERRTLSELADRLTLVRGMVGFLVCRSIADRQAALARCREIYASSKKLVMILDDVAIFGLLGVFRGNPKPRDAIDAWLRQRIDEVVTAADTGTSIDRPCKVREAATALNQDRRAAAGTAADLNKEGALAAIQAAAQPEFAGALVTYAVMERPGGSATLLSCRWQFHTVEKAPRARTRYGDLLLGECWLSRQEAEAGLTRLLGDGTADVLDGVRLDGTFEWPARHTVRAFGLHLTNYSGWPEQVFEFHRPSEVTLPVLGMPIAGQGLRPYLSGSEAIFDWVWKESARGLVWYGGLPPNAFSLVVVAPDPRARVRPVDWRGSNLELAIERAPALPVLLQVQFLGSDSRPACVEAQDPGAAISLTVPSKCDAAHVVLLSGTEILDQGLIKESDVARTAQGTAKSSAVDVLVVVALQDEKLALLKCDEPGHPWHESSDSSGFTIHTRSMPLDKDGQLIQIAVARATDMGEVPAAATAARLLKDMSPKVIAMTGVCAGDRRKTSLGDVIVGERVFNFEQGKLKVHYDEPARREELFPDIRTFNLTPQARQRAEDFPSDWADKINEQRPITYSAQEEWLLWVLSAPSVGAPEDLPERPKRCPAWAKTLERLRQRKLLRPDRVELTKKGLKLAGQLRERFENGPPIPAGRPRVHVGVIASGSKVQDDPELFPMLEKRSRRTIGVEMEASAIGAVAEIEGRKALVIKSVQDHADHEKDDQFRAYAAEASARFLFAFLKRAFGDVLGPPQMGTGEGPGR